MIFFIGVDEFLIKGVNPALVKQAEKPTNFLPASTEVVWEVLNLGFGPPRDGLWPSCVVK